MYRPLILTGLAAIIFASSCDKVGTINNERAKLEVEVQQISKEMVSIDDKFESGTALGDFMGTTLTIKGRATAKAKKVDPTILAGLLTV